MYYIQLNVLRTKSPSPKHLLPLVVCFGKSLRMTYQPFIRKKTLINGV